MKAKKIGNFLYVKQWWKPKFLESKDLDSFVLSTDLGYDFWFDADIFAESEKAATMYIKPSQQKYFRNFEAVEYMPPRSHELNETIMPSWIKMIGKGKFSLFESSETEKIFEFSSEKTSGTYKAVREHGTSDFWKVMKEAQYKKDKCMECEVAPKYEVKWAEGMAHAWFCESHFNAWKNEHKDDIDYVKEIKDGKAADEFADNTNPNIKDKVC